MLCKSEREREIENGVWVSQLELIKTTQYGVWVSQLELIKTTQLNVVCE